MENNELELLKTLTKKVDAIEKSIDELSAKQTEDRKQINNLTKFKELIEKQLKQTERSIKSKKLF